MTDEGFRRAETPDEDPRGKTSDDYEREWGDLDEKVILAQILTELTQIRVLLSEGADEPRDGSSGGESYECVKCGTVVPAGGRERHAEKEHNAPPGVAEQLFEVVE